MDRNTKPSQGTRLDGQGKPAVNDRPKCPKGPQAAAKQPGRPVCRGVWAQSFPQPVQIYLAPHRSTPSKARVSISKKAMRVADAKHQRLAKESKKNRSLCSRDCGFAGSATGRANVEPYLSSAQSAARRHERIITSERYQSQLL